MGSFSGTPMSGFWRRLLQLNRSTNQGLGVGGSLYNINSGDGYKSSININDDQFLIQPQVDDTTTTVDIKTQGGASIFTADTTNKKILAGETQVSVNTHYKEFGMYQVTSDIGYHQGLVCNNMIIGNDNDESWNATAMFGNDANPAETVDISTANKAPQLTALLWFIEDNITIDSCRFIVNSNNVSARTLNFHLMSYTLDTSSHFGDLSAGAVIADGTVDVTISQVKTGTLSNVGTVDINAGKVVICTMENEDSVDEQTVQVVVKYHIR